MGEEGQVTAGRVSKWVGLSGDGGRRERLRTWTRRKWQWFEEVEMWLEGGTETPWVHPNSLI